MSKESSCPSKKTSIGGQALIEGIMMRGPKVTAMAVRNPEGEIVLEKWETETTARAKIFKLPIIRGVFGFIDSMRFGYKCLMRSAEISGLDELEDEVKREKGLKKAEKAKKKAAKKAAKAEVSEVSDTVADENVTEATDEAQDVPEAEAKAPEQKKESNVLLNAIMAVAMVLGVILSISLFIMLPSFIYIWISGIFPILRPSSPALASLVKSAFEGILKIVILVVYMALVSMMKDIRRTFQYHGAEHKTIFCYEHGKELTVENVKGERRFHPRCGTSFLILMLLVSMFVSFFIDPISIALTGGIPPTFVRAIIRLLLLPLIMGVGYELIKFAGRHDNLFTRIISAPGVWLQHMTVFEPTDDMIECAITAFKEVIPEDDSDKY